MAKRKQLPRGMHLRGNVYYARIMGMDGAMIRKRLSEDFSTATIMLSDLRKKVELQKAGVLPKNLGETIRTFAELRDRYTHHMKARNLSDRSLESFLVAFKRIVLENRFTAINDMTLEKVEAWVRGCTQAGIRGQTINQYVGLMVTALRWAHDNGFIARNPLANWQRVRYNDPRKRRDFQPDEIRRFLQAETDPKYFLLWLVYFSTGLRPTAGKNVCWEWIDWQSKILRLPMEWNKSRRVHEIPLGQTLLEQLALLRDKENRQTGRIFTPVCPKELLRRLRKTCRAAGIDTDGICTHSIRHTVATMIYKKTGNLKAVQEILGHSNASTTMHYLHVTAEEKRRAINALDLGIDDDGLNVAAGGN